MKIKQNSWIGNAVFIVLFTYFSLGLIQDKVANACFYALLLLGCVHLVLSIGSKNAYLKMVVRAYWPIFVATTGMAVAIAANQISRGQFAIKAYDDPSRLALVGVLVLVINLIPAQHLHKLRWAFALGAIMGTIKIADLTDYGRQREAMLDFIPIIAYSQLVLLLGVFSILSFNRETDATKTKILLLSLAMIASLYNIYISQTRGAWIAIPLFAVLVCLTLTRNMHPVKVLGYSAVIVCCVVALVSPTQIVRERVAEANQDIQLYAGNENLDTSVGVRLQLWQGSWTVFKENPLHGVGRDGFSAALADLRDRGLITPFAATFPHSHNEILYNMATLGVFGLLAILGIYFVPAYYFIREIRHADHEVRAAAAMGLSLCLGYFVFGLVDVMFMWRRCDIFYALACALFIVFITKRKNLMAAHQSDAPGTDRFILDTTTV